MATKTFTLEDFKESTETLRNIFNSYIQGHSEYEDLKCIFEIGLSNFSLFPNIRLSEEQTAAEYIKKWIKGYSDALNNPPSKRTATPKNSCSDPAVQAIVQIAKGLDDEKTTRIAAYHNLFMSAENIQGNLLEEYISISTRPYGWIWCQGNVMRAIDFCSSDGKILLQIKNKSNTENSSSSAIRSGTDIKKWYRLGTQSKNGMKSPTYKWEKLNDIINSHITTGHKPDSHMTEEDYQNFLRNTTLSNPDIISSQ